VYVYVYNYGTTRFVERQTNSGGGGAVTGYSLELLCHVLNDPRLETRQGLKFCLLSKMSRTVLGPIQPPIEWVPGFFDQGQAAGS